MSQSIIELEEAYFFRSSTKAPTSAPELFSHTWERGLIIGFVSFLFLSLVRLWSVSYLIRKESIQSREETVRNTNTIVLGYHPTLVMRDKYIFGPSDDALLWFPVNRLQISIIVWVTIKILLQLYQDGVNILFVAYTAHKAPDKTRYNLAIWGCFLVVMNILLKPCYQILKPIKSDFPNVPCGSHLQSAETAIRSFFSFFFGWLWWLVSGRDPVTSFFILREKVSPHCTRYLPGSFYNWAFILIHLPKKIELNRQLSPSLPVFGRGRAFFLQMNYAIIIVSYSYLISAILSNSQYRTSLNAIYAYISCILLLPDLIISFTFWFTTYRYAIVALPSCIFCCRHSEKLAIPREMMWGVFRSKKKVSMFRIFIFFWDPNIILLPTFLIRDRYCPMPSISINEPLLNNDTEDSPPPPPPSDSDNGEEISRRPLTPIPEESFSDDGDSSHANNNDKDVSFVYYSSPHLLQKSLPDEAIPRVETE
uniref:Uncharacterized protein n=1 Tax=Aureoumbra lagunensis TaxID=44058 RepID=A0A7S3JY76_9STRA|mmetsp:Transcript_14626/g.22042  ORF Transcript_14626/g.22042 Transcript_14626/m.22042 type:complete len:479 (+) Transcript_14626:59-1495(+)